MVFIKFYFTCQLYSAFRQLRC